MKRISLLIVSLVLSVCVNAQLLWKISGNNLPGNSYLFGTHHVAPASVLDDTPGFKNALHKVDKVYGELDMSLLSDPAVQIKMAQYAMAPADSTLSKVLPANTLATIDSLFAGSGLPVTTAQLDMLKPASVANTLALILAKQVMPEFNPADQIDTKVQTMAHEAGKAVAGLEEVESQLKLLFGSPIAKQAEALKKIMDNPAKAIELTRSLSNAYMTGDLDRIGELMADPDNITEEESAALLAERNSAWLDILLGALPTASMLVVVGAGHLPGENGLINLLRNAGYTVEPVTSDTL